MLVICLVYSWCCVKSRVDEIQAAMTPDAEIPRPRLRIRSRRIFCFYLLHLAARLVLGVTLTAIQNLIFYPFGFPVRFFCVLPETQRSNVTDYKESHFPCHNPVASEKSTLAAAVWLVHAIFAFLVFVEMVYLSARVTQNVDFSFDSEFCLKYFFHQNAGSVSPARFRERMKKRILEQTELLEPLIQGNGGNEGSRMRLDDIFLDVIIYTGRAQEEFLKECQRHLIYDFYLKPESQRGSIAINARTELFLSNLDAENPRKILVVGRPGIGKSLLCQRLLRDWSKTEVFGGNTKRFKYAFLFRFRSLYFESAERISLRQLLNRAAHLEGDLDDHVFQELLDHPEKILLVFDGLDEFKDHPRCTSYDASRFENSSTEPAPASALYVKLLRGNLLPGATVMTTSRPTVLESVDISSFDRTVEIVGFTEEKVQRYVKNYCKQDPEQSTAASISELIRSNLSLLSLCYIPVNCRIFCFFLKELINMKTPATSKGNTTLPTRLTDIYQGVLRLLIFKHHPEYRDKPFRGNERFSDSVEHDLSNLGTLARKGIADRRMIFDSEEVKEMKNCGLLNQMPDSRLSPVEFKQCFCFIHLTLQEFLAAREIVKMNPDELNEFVVGNAEDPKWHLVIQFVAGLLHGQQHKAINSMVDCLHRTLLSQTNAKMALLMMKCLYEYNDDTTAKKAASELQRNERFQGKIRLWGCQATPVDCTAVVYFFKHLNSVEYKLDLSSNSIAEGGCKELAKLLMEGAPVTLHIPKNDIPDQGIISLTEAMSSNKCQLKSLNILLNDLMSPEAFLHICEVLKNRNCRLICLRFGESQETDKLLWVQLCESLEHVNCRLTCLRLFSEEAGTDADLLRLSETLKHPICQLTCLRIYCHKMTNHGVKHICEALKNQPCKLTSLDLISNRITAVVVSHLCEAIRHKNCKLYRVNITSWNIIDQANRDLQKAIEAKQHGCLADSIGIT